MVYFRENCHGSSQNIFFFKVFFPDGGGVSEIRKIAICGLAGEPLVLAGIHREVVFVRKKMPVYPQREPYPLSDSSVCHFVVGASCSVIYPLALSTKH